MQVFLEIINNNLIYILAFILLAILVMFIFYISISIKLSKLRKRYEKFTGGDENADKNIETMLYDYNKNVVEIGEKYGKLLDMMQEIDDEMKYCTQKIGVIRYNPFDEMGGNLCYAVALLDANNNGVVLNGIHSRNGSFTYAKPIERGVSQYVLTDEELQAIEKAKEYSYKPSTIENKKIMKVIKPIKKYKTSHKIKYNNLVKDDMPKPQGGFDVNKIATSIFGDESNTDVAKKEEFEKTTNVGEVQSTEINEKSLPDDFELPTYFNNEKSNKD